jgi:hypothetical protein
MGGEPANAPATGAVVSEACGSVVPACGSAAEGDDSDTDDMVTPAIGQLGQPRRFLATRLWWVYSLVQQEGEPW